jgi:hypothetical protein
MMFTGGGDTADRNKQVCEAMGTIDSDSDLEILSWMTVPAKPMFKFLHQT